MKEIKTILEEKKIFKSTNLKLYGYYDLLPEDAEEDLVQLNDKNIIDSHKYEILNVDYYGILTTIETIFENSESDLSKSIGYFLEFLEALTLEVIVELYNYMMEDDNLVHWEDMGEDAIRFIIKHYQDEIKEIKDSLNNILALHKYIENVKAGASQAMLENYNKEIEQEAQNEKEIKEFQDAALKEIKGSNLKPEYIKIVSLIVEDISNISLVQYYKNQMKELV